MQDLGSYLQSNKIQTGGVINQERYTISEIALCDIGYVDSKELLLQE